MLEHVIHNKLPSGIDILHPSDTKPLKVTAKDDNFGDLVIFTDGSNTDLGVGASAIFFQYPDILNPIQKSDSINTKPYMCQ